MSDDVKTSELVLLQIRISAELRKAVRVCAAEAGVTVTEFVTELLLSTIGKDINE